MSSKEILTILGRLDIPVANHMSVMDDNMVEQVEHFFSDVKKRAAERHAHEVEKELRERQQRRKEERRMTDDAKLTGQSSTGSDPQVRGNNRDRAMAEGTGQAARTTSRDGDRQARRPNQTANGPRRNGQAAPASYPNRDRDDAPRQPGARSGGADRPRSDSSNRPRSSSDGGSSRGPRSGGGRDNQRSGNYQGGGQNRPGNRDNRGGSTTGGRSGGGTRDSNRTGGTSRPGFGTGGGRSGGGNRQGGFAGGGGRSGSSAPAAAASKPTAPGSLRKDKGKERGRGKEFARHEEFNEQKLQRSRRRNDHRQQATPTEITVEGPMSVGDFAKLLNREPAELIKKLFMLGIMATINQEIEIDAMELIAGEYHVTMTVTEPVDEEALDMLVEEEDPAKMTVRPPVVTIMGHVDHGKTTLLDAIRESKVTTTESGGITQHIGAYQVPVRDRLITFLDTPGHEAFTTMRARGAQVTDLTILVVAADDGVMPQTVEAINHAKAAKVPIIVAVNKMDKEGANPDRVKQELAQYELIPEEWGGDTIFAEISALAHTGLDDLLEVVLLVADVQELKANPDGRPRGTVVEAKLDKGRGSVATILVQNGTLRVGDIVVAGTTYGRVRAMINDVGRRVKQAGPSAPVEIQGLSGVPSAGDQFVVYDDDKGARNLVDKRTNKEKQEQMQTTSKVTLDDLYKQIQEGKVAELNVIVKADVQGSVEALVQSIEKIDVSGVRVRVIHRGAGAITESDVSLASASNAIIIGFHVRPDVNASRMAEAEKVDIRLYRVIYNVISELESAMKGMLEPEYKEAVLGHAEVRETFNISRIGTIAGCYITDGKLSRDAEARLIRDGIVVYEGKLDSLKRFKDDAREVQSGYECGVTLERYNDIKVGDVVEAFEMVAVKQV